MSDVRPDWELLFRRARAVARVGKNVDDLRPGKPCGRCRQLLHEAGGHRLRVNGHHTLGELLPDAFGPDEIR